jgi:hypothetical protein
MGAAVEVVVVMGAAAERVAVAGELEDILAKLG